MPGLLYLLLVLLRIWDNLLIDFYIPGSISKRYNNIFIIVN